MGRGIKQGVTKVGQIGRGKLVKPLMDVVLREECLPVGMGITSQRESLGFGNIQLGIGGPTIG